MSIAITLTDKHGHEINYDANSNGFGTTATAFSFLSAMLILCTCYPNAICHVE